MELQTTSVNTRAALKVVGWTVCVGRVVASEVQRRLAGDIALRVQGVLAVANMITVTN